MKRKMISAIVLTILLALTGCQEKTPDGVVRTRWSHTYEGYPIVYISSDVSADGLLSAYESLEASFDGTAAIKLSKTDTDEGFEWMELIQKLSELLAESVVLESPSSVNFFDYDCTIVLSHFRSHDVAGFNGAVKQAAAISAELETANRLSAGLCDLDLLAEKGKQTVDSLDGHILYISVMDRATIESAGVILPESNTYDIGILSSYDPIALDQACIDIIAILGEGVPFLSQIEHCNGLRTLIHGEQIGLGSRTYALTALDS
ncbi:MAG: DUF362 domain-containing protein [Oscillospiraceae bacterium]|nr:DUF362 domain-containing protein [Oscillospiraceae bacterium]